MAWEVTDLPEPDSPTMARVRPAPTSKLKPSTARKRPPGTSNSTLRERTDSRAGSPGGLVG